jgi:hypothetical protein
MCNNDHSPSEAVNSLTGKRLKGHGLNPVSRVPTLKISHGARHWKDCRYVFIGGACGPGRQQSPRIALVSSGGRHIPQIKINLVRENTIIIETINAVGHLRCCIRVCYCKDPLGAPGPKVAFLLLPITNDAPIEQWLDPKRSPMWPDPRPCGGLERGEGGQPLYFTFKVPVAIPDQVDQMEAFLGFTAADLFTAAAGIGIRMQV